MSDYQQTVFFTPKDSMLPGTEEKRTRGFEIDGQLSLISAAIATKHDADDFAAFGDYTSNNKVMTPLRTTELVAEAVGSGDLANPLIIGTGVDGTTAGIILLAGQQPGDTNDLIFMHGEMTGSPLAAGVISSSFDINTVTASFDLFSGGGESVFKLTASPLGENAYLYSDFVPLTFIGTPTFDDGFLTQDPIQVSNAATSEEHLIYASSGTVLALGSDLAGTSDESKEVHFRLYDEPNDTVSTIRFKEGGDAEFPADIRNINQTNTSLYWSSFAYNASGANLLQFEPSGSTGAAEFQIVARASGGTTYTWQFGSDGKLWRNGVVVIP